MILAVMSYDICIMHTKKWCLLIGQNKCDVSIYLFTSEMKCMNDFTSEN